MSQFELKVQEVDGVTTLALRGRAGAGDQRDLASNVEAVLMDGPSRVVLDLTALDFAGSAVIGQLMLLAQSVKTGGGWVAMACPEGNLRQVLDRCRASAIAPVLETVDAARAEIGA